MVAEEDATTSEFDKHMAATLAEAVRAYGKPRKTGIAKSKPSTWADHFRLLRTKDGIPEAEIRKVVVWYATHIGEAFVPEAFSGESFRRKYAALERAAGRDLATVEGGGRHNRYPAPGDELARRFR